MTYPTVESGHVQVVFDFDGTLAEDTWPSPRIGKPIKKGVRMLKHYFDQGYQITVYTARPNSHEGEIWDWLKENELGDFVYDVVTGKPVAGLYVDDRAFNPKEIYYKKAEPEIYVHQDGCELTTVGVCSCNPKRVTHGR